jgi:hypothetical protein
VITWDELIQLIDRGLKLVISNPAASAMFVAVLLSGAFSNSSKMEPPPPPVEALMTKPVQLAVLPEFTSINVVV